MIRSCDSKGRAGGKPRGASPPRACARPTLTWTWSAGAPGGRDAFVAAPHPCPSDPIRPTSGSAPGGRLLPPHAPSTSWHSPAAAAERALPGPGEEGPPGQGRPRGPPPQAGAGMQTKLLSSTGCFEVATAAHSHLAAKAWLSAGRIVKRAPYLTTSTVGHNTSPFWTSTKEVLGFLFCVGYSGEN